MHSVVRVQAAFGIVFLSARRFESAEFLHAGKINYQRPFGSFFRTIVLFDRIARWTFCNFVDLKDQQEIFRAFSRAQEKATQIYRNRTKMITLFFD